MSCHEGARHGQGLVDMVKGFGVGRDGRFVGGEDGAKVGDGHVSKMDGGRWAKGERVVQKWPGKALMKAALHLCGERSGL